MNKYFLNDGETYIGPFSIEQLKARKITLETPIWFEGLDYWVTAKDVDELKILFDGSSPASSSVIGSVSTMPPTIRRQEVPIVDGNPRAMDDLMVFFLAIDRNCGGDLFEERGKKIFQDRKFKKKEILDDYITKIKQQRSHDIGEVIA